MEGFVPMTSPFTTSLLSGTGETHRGVSQRGLLRPPPTRFMIEFLPISNKGSHGMKISPHSDERESASIRSGDLEYEIWRKWEDILWFQQDLETVYRRAAREKKVRLAQGKGVKGLNGHYKQDMASSFESLPAGPLPSSVAQDIHQYLPRLSKRGAVFRTSQKMVERRQKEFRAFFEALFSDDVPSLIRELRATHSVTDFFGLWRRDYDLMEKSPKHRRNSITSSVYFSYFAESPPAPASSSSPSTSRKRSSRERPQSIGSIKSTILKSSIQDIPQSSPSLSTELTHRLSCSSDNESIPSSGIRPRALSTTSSDASSTYSDEPSTGVGSLPAIVGESPLTFHHNPILSVERPCVLEVLPEERELRVELPEKYLDPPERPQADTLIIDLEVDLEAKTRQKVGSLAFSDQALKNISETILSVDSSVADLVDVVVPPDDDVSTSTVSEVASLTMASYGCSEPSTKAPPLPRLTTPTMANSKSRYTESSFELITSTSLFIKAAHNSTIIMLRVRKDASFEDIRQRLYEKFSRQERVRLSKEFSLVMVDSPALPGETESQPMSLSAYSADKVKLCFIDTQDDWEQVVLVRDSNKVTLKVFDTQKS